LRRPIRFDIGIDAGRQAFAGLDLRGDANHPAQA
jgi:hypothetical protein